LNGASTNALSSVNAVDEMSMMMSMQQKGMPQSSLQNKFNPFLGNSKLVRSPLELGKSGIPGKQAQVGLQGNKI